MKDEQIIALYFARNEDAIGETVWDDLYLSVSKTTRTDEKDEEGRFVEVPKDAKQLAEDAGDNATDGLLDDWTDQAEQRAWFLAATMGKV